MVMIKEPIHVIAVIIHTLLIRVYMQTTKETKYVAFYIKLINSPLLIAHAKGETPHGEMKLNYKRRKYHFRIEIDDREYYQTSPDTGYINRETPREIGLPSLELLIGTDKAKYGTSSKNGAVEVAITIDPNMHEEKC